jgi:hypothetical protein
MIKMHIDQSRHCLKKGGRRFVIKRVTKENSAEVLSKFHYLTGISKTFKSGFNYGLFEANCEDILGVIIFTGFPVPELAKGMFGLERNDQQGLFELSRLCIVPRLQNSEHNIASWFVSKSIKILRSETLVRAILSYADDAYHKGTVYAACNFNYYGLTAKKKDFYELVDGQFVKHSRGPVSGLDGEWRPRTRKHRFVMIYDLNLTMQWKKCVWGSKHDQVHQES